MTIIDKRYSKKNLIWQFKIQKEKMTQKFPKAKIE